MKIRTVGRRALPTLGLALGMLLALAHPAFATVSATDSGFTYYGTWTTGSSEHYTTNLHAAAAINFTIPSGKTSTVALRGNKNPNNGQVSVVVDGGNSVQVSEQSTSFLTDQTVWTSGTLSAGSHTLIVSASTAAASVTGATLSSNFASFTGTGYLPGSNTLGDSSFTYAGTWTAGTGEHHSSAVGSGIATANFTAGAGGSTVTLRGDKGPNNGNVVILVDQADPVTVNENAGSTATNQTLWTSGTLAPGNHELRVIVRSNTGSVSGANVSNGIFAGRGYIGATLNLDWETCDESQWNLDGTHGGLEAQTPSQQSWIISTSPLRTGHGCSQKNEIANTSGDLMPGGGYRSLLAKYDSNEGFEGGNDFVYGLSIQVPVIDETQTWELHQRPNIYSVGNGIAIAPHAILFRNGQLQYREMTGSANWDGTQWTGWSNYQDQKVLVTSPSTNTWYDIMVHIKASEGSDGVTEVYVRPSGSAWPSTPTWSNSGPTLQYIPGGLDPNVPNKISSYDADSSGRSGFYLEMGLYNGSNTWYNTAQTIDLFTDNLRRYTDVASAKTGFPA
jgi:hypothetical protein